MTIIILKIQNWHFPQQSKSKILIKKRTLLQLTPFKSKLKKQTKNSTEIHIKILSKTRNLLQSTIVILENQIIIKTKKKKNSYNWPNPHFPKQFIAIPTKKSKFSSKKRNFLQLATKILEIRISNQNTKKKLELNWKLNLSINMIHKIRRINIAEWSISNEFLSPVSEEPVRNDDEDRGGHRDLDLPPRRYQKLHCRFDHHRHNHNHHHHQAQQPRKSTTTQKSKYQDKNRNKKNHIYVKQTKRSMAASLVEISRVSNFSKPWNFETTKHKKFSEREKDSQGLKGLDRWRGWKNWLMIIKFTTSWRKCPPICYVISVLLY